MLPPERLYKYRPFDERTLELLVEDKVFFADPSTFNDPLDTRPTLSADLPVFELELLLKRLTTRRVSAEMEAAARRFRYPSQKITEHIERHTRLDAQNLLREIAYMATNPDYEDAPPAPQKRLLCHHIESELLRQYGKGIFSLASRFECALMWSHYGDQHRGICLGYSVPAHATGAVHAVSYSGGRLILASRVKAMLDGDEEARREVDGGVLLRKAPDWRYEQEWRMLGDRGLVDSRLELEEVTFGARCLFSVRHAVVRALQGRDRPVKFFDVHEVAGEFGLSRRELDEEEMQMQPRRALSIWEEFKNLSTGDSADD